jgi:hypothetical protein
MIHRYWVATFKIPRGHHGHKLQLPPGERISRLLEWKVDLSRDGMLVTALMEDAIEESQTVEEPQTRRHASSDAA